MKKLLVFLVLYSSFSFAQTGVEGNIIGLGKPYKDKIVLRWNVTNYQVFKQMLKDGVHIERIILNKSGEPENKNWQKITTEPVRAWTLEQIKNSRFNSDTAVAVVAEGLYGKNALPEKVSLIEQVKLQDIDMQNRHMMVSLYAALSKDAAIVAGLGYEDKLNVDTTKSYVYRIVPTIPIGLPGTLHPCFIYVTGRDLNYIPKFFGLTTKNGDGYISLNWPKSEGKFTGYYVERSTDNQTFKRLNAQIYIPETAEDTTSQNDFYSYYDSVENYKKYYYKLIGVNSFGEQIAFDETVRGMAEDLTPPASPMVFSKKEGKKVILNWSKPEEKDIKGYFLLKGKRYTADEGLLVPDMLPPTTITYTFNLPENFRSSYYRLMAVDTAGNTSLSNSIYIYEPDLMPPAPPSGLSGHIDTSGRVHLKWSMDQKEDALRGYKIFIANQGDHTYSAISDIVPDTSYTFSVTTQTLTKKLFVKIVAVDGNFNHSDYSKPLVLNRPDKIPPPKPVILDYVNTTSGIVINWSKSSSEDHKEFILYKKVYDETKWVEIHRSPKSSTYTDKDLMSGISYTYTLRAVDSSGLYSEYAHPITIRTSYSPPKESTSLTGTFTGGKVQLKWSTSTNPVAFYILYKDSGQGLTLYKSLPATTNTFEEPGKAGPKGKYALKIKYLDDQESDLLICK
jgi:hypothetical protein